MKTSYWRHRIGAAVGIGSITALALAGCAGGSTGGSGDSSFSLTYAVANTAESPYAAMAEAYMKEHPGVTIELNPQPFDRYGENLRVQLQGGNAPDVVQTTPGRGQPQSVVTLAEAGFLAPVDTTLDVDAALFGLDGEVYGQPVDLSATGILYASALAGKAGIDAPTDTSTLLSACKAATGADVSFFALAGSVPSNTGLMALSISATRVYATDPDWNAKRAAGDVTFVDSAGWKDTLQTVLDLNDAGCFQPGAEGGGFDAITNGFMQGTSLAAFAPGSNDLASVAPDAGLQVRGFPPADGDAQHIFVSPISSLSVNKTTKSPQAATDFLAWMAEPAQAQQFAELAGTLPVTGIEGVDLSGGMYEPIAELLADGGSSPLPRATWPNASVYEALSEGSQGLLTGQRTIAQVLEAMDAAWDGK